MYSANQHEETVLRFGRYPESIRKSEQATDCYPQTIGVTGGSQSLEEVSSEGKSNMQVSGLGRIEDTHGSAQVTPKSLPFMVQLLLGASLIIGFSPLFQRQNTQEQQVPTAKQASTEAKLKAKSAEEIEAEYAKKQMMQMESEHTNVIRSNDQSQSNSVNSTSDQSSTKETSDNNFDNIFNAAKFWTSEWGNDIRAAMSKGPCNSADLIADGYQYRGYSTIPISRLKNANEAWYTFDDRAVTVVGCWIHQGDGHARYKMVRKKDKKVLEGDMNFGDGSWEVTYKELEQ